LPQYRVPGCLRFVLVVPVPVGIYERSPEVEEVWRHRKIGGEESGVGVSQFLNVIRVKLKKYPCTLFRRQMNPPIDGKFKIPVDESVRGHCPIDECWIGEEDIQFVVCLNGGRIHGG